MAFVHLLARLTMTLRTGFSFIGAVFCLIFWLSVPWQDAHAQAVADSTEEEVLAPPPPPPVGSNNANIEAQTVPATMVAGQLYDVTVNARNTGENQWTSAEQYALGSLSPANNYTWGINRVPITGTEMIRYWETKRFAFQVKAPSTPGVYSFHWGMLQENRGSFGNTTPVSVTVVAPAPVRNAQVVATSVPSTMVSGQRYTIAITMKNTGNMVWTPPMYRLGSENPQNNVIWGVGRIEVTSRVQEGEQYQFVFDVVAPAAGTYSMRWGMLEEDQAWFGGVSNNTVTVTSPQKPVLTVSRPTSLIANKSFDFIWSTANTTSLTQVCTANGTGYKVNESLALSGTRTQVAQSAWVGYPSSCVLTATGPGGTTTYSETLTTSAAATAPVPMLTVQMSPTALTAGQSFTLTWSTTNATSLTRVCTASGTGYNVNESLAVNGSKTQVALAAWAGYPSTCTWTATGSGGTTTRTQTLSVPSPLPTIVVQRSPATMTAGEPFTLTWTTTNATSVTRACTASGTGFTSSGAMPATSSTQSGTASAAWVGYPSSCTWTATGSAGTAKYVETMTTVAASTGNVTYIHTDGLGSPVARTDAARNLISRTRYEPYGYVASGVTPTIGFAGHVNDSDTGLTYMQQRYYDPVAGRFLNIDPIETNVDDADKFNRYGYARQNPFGYVDPDGRDEVPIPTITITAQRPAPAPLPIASSVTVQRPDQAVRISAAPEISQNSTWTTAKECASDQLGLDELAAAGAVASGWPIPGTKRFVTPGSSQGTSIAGMAANQIFGNARSPVRLPTIVGGPGTGRKLAVAGTKSVARFAGRAVPVVGWGMLAYDGVMVAKCMVEGE